MTRKEFFALIARLREEHGADFERWYDQANYPDIKEYCEIGFLLCRCHPFEEEKPTS